MKQDYLFVYATTVLICGFAFVCFLLNQLHLDLRNILFANEGKTLRHHKIKEWKGAIFSVILIIFAVIFVILSTVNSRAIPSVQ